MEEAVTECLKKTELLIHAEVLNYDADLHGGNIGI